MAIARIQIVRITSETVAGRRMETETPYFSCWCDTMDLYGAELYDALHIKLENTIVFKVRFCKQIKAMKHRVKEFVIDYDGERYGLYAVDFGNNDKNYVFLKANCIS